MLMPPTMLIAPRATAAGASAALFKNAGKKLSHFRKKVVRQLSRCKETGKPIHITSHALGEGALRSFVEDMYQSGGDDIVVLKWFDAHNIASRTHLFVEEILSVDLAGKR